MGKLFDYLCAIFKVVTLCSFMDGYEQSGGTYCFCLQIEVKYRVLFIF